MRRCDHGVPSDGLESGQALGDSRHLGQARHPLGRSDGEELQSAGFDKLQRHAEVVEHAVDAAGDKIVERWRRAAIWHVLQLHMRHHLEHFRCQLRRRAVALRGVGDLAGIGLRVGDELFDITCGNLVRIDHEGVGHAGHHDDRNELAWIKFQVWIEVLIDDQRRWRRSEQGVAVGIGLRHDFGADIAAGAGVVFDDHRSPPFARQPLREDARHHIGGTAGREGDDNLHHSRRIVLGVSIGGGENGSNAPQHRCTARDKLSECHLVLLVWPA